MYDSYRQGQKGTFRCFCQKVFPLAVCAHLLAYLILCARMIHINRYWEGTYGFAKKTDRGFAKKVFFSAACAYLGLLPIVCLIYKTNSGFAKKGVHKFFLSAAFVYLVLPLLCV